MRDALLLLQHRADLHLPSMPTRDQAISLLMAVMKAPLDKFARTLNEIPGKLVRTVEAIRVQKAESEAA